MKKYVVNGGKPLSGGVTISGSKNVVTKAIVAACLTSEEVEIKNVPLIADLEVALEVAEVIGAHVKLSGHTLKIKFSEIKNTKVLLDAGAKSRATSLFLAPLLSRAHEAIVPNPGGCRLGARPIDRHIKGLEKMGATITYVSADGYFHAKIEKLHGTTYRFEKNTHTGTETLILAAVCAEGKTVLHNAAEEPEVDDLINLLNKMGARIARKAGKTITIEGVSKLHGTSYSIMPDRNEAVTFAILSALTGGHIYLKGANLGYMQTFLEKFQQAGGQWEIDRQGARFFMEDGIVPVDVTTLPHPGFMTDWQGPWGVFMTQAAGTSEIHETIYENRFSYVSELKKMGAKLKFFNPKVSRPKEFYNFNFEENHLNQGLKIFGPSRLHNAVLNIADLRAGATLVIASLTARGTSIIYGIEHLERGYEAFDKRLQKLGADIKVVEETLPTA